jgi:hypothetical protein
MWADDVDIDPDQRPSIAEPHEMIEVFEHRGDCAIRPSDELRHLTTLSSGGSPVRCSEDTDARSDGEEGATADKDGNPVPKDRERTCGAARSAT